MRRLLKILAWSLAVVVAIPFLALGVVIIAANTGPGRSMIETLVPRVTDGMVRIAGIGGRFPDAIRLHQVAVADPHGVWVTVDDAALDWSPWHLLEGEVDIDRLEAQRVAVARLPVSSGSGSSSGGASIPSIRIVVSRLHVAQLEVAPAVAGQAIAQAVDGNGQLVASDTGQVHLAVTALQPHDGAPLDHYIVDAALAPSGVRATVNVAEAPHGLIANLAQLPDLGAIAVTASADGPLNALATQATIDAGQLHGNLNGKVNVDGRTADMRFAVAAPAMTPAPGVAWSSIQLDGNVHGPFEAPQATARLAADGLTAGGAAIGSLRANVSGDTTGRTALHAEVDGLRVPGPSPDVLAKGPLTLDATAQLVDPKRPVQFAVKDALFTADGTADVNHAQMRLTIPNLQPLAAVGGVNLEGNTALDITATRASGDVVNLTVTGGVGITGGLAPVPAMVGQQGKIDLAASLHGADVTLSHLAVTGAGFSVTASGQYLNQVLGADWSVALNDLAMLRPDLAGTLAAQGHAEGALTSLSVTSELTGNLAAQGQRLEQVNAKIELNGLPDAPSGQVTAGGMLFNAPLNIAVNAAKQASGIHVVIDRASWKSLNAGGTLDLAPGAMLPTGKLTLAMDRLADLAPVLGRPITGAISASLDASPSSMRINAVVTGAAMPGTAALAKAGLDATITNPTEQPVIDGSLTVDGVDANGLRGSGRATAKGSLDSLALTLAFNSDALYGKPAHLDTAATLDATARMVALASLQGAWGRETVRLLGPAQIGFAEGIAVDRLHLGFRQGELTVAGRWGSTAAGPGSGTALNITLTNFPADVVSDFAPQYAANGSIGAEARLSGTPALPEGTIHIHADGVRLRAGPGQAMPPATSTIDVALAGTTARVNAHVTAGRSNLTLSGQAPLNQAGTMDLRVGGAVDLAMLNPLLTAQGRNVKGQLELNLTVGGTLAVPRPGGNVRLVDGEVQDSSVGAHIDAMTALVQFEGQTVRLAQFRAKAGPGTISGAGTVTIAAAPVIDLTLRASDARLLSSDLVTAVADFDLTVRGTVNGDLTLAGTIRNRTTSIQVPEKLPPSVAVLPVRNAGSPPPQPAPPTPEPSIALNLTLDAPNQIYIRGRGVDAELGGRVVFTGTAAQPIASGGFHLRRGTFSLAGQTLNLTEGTIDFVGNGITNPALKLVASVSNATMTSTLTISGSVKDPKITLSSVPDMPQDEILSQLLFNQAKAKLTPFQVAEIAAALASLSGVGGGGDPLNGLRNALGLDQLSVGNGPGGGAALQVGRYLAPGVRVGASQSATGQGTQATVQIDLTKGLQLESQLGTGSSSASPGVAGTSNGTGLGLKYQFEY